MDTQGGFIDSAKVVGYAFVLQYYRIIHSFPEFAYKFYKDSSVLTRPDHNGVSTTVTTMEVSSVKIWLLIVFVWVFTWCGSLSFLSPLVKQNSWDPIVWVWPDLFVYGRCALHKRCLTFIVLNAYSALYFCLLWPALIRWVAPELFNLK